MDPCALEAELCCAGDRLARATSETEPRKKRRRNTSTPVPCGNVRDLALRVRVRLIVLAEQVLAIIVAVGSTHDAVNVLPRGQFGILGEPRQVGRALVIEFDQDHGAVYAVVVDARGIRAADPAEPSALDLALDLVHPDAGVAVVHVAHVQVDEIQKLPLLRLRKIGGSSARVVEHHVVLERFGKVVVSRFRELA